MQDQDLLSSFIEVGIGIAGFSSVVVALSRQVITPEVKLAFLQLWIQSAAVIFFSALPLLLSTSGVQQALIYVVASYAYGVYLLIVFLFTPARKRLLQHRILLIGLLFPVIVFLNAIYLGAAWPYLCVILGGIFVAFVSFYQLIKMTWASNDRAQELDDE